MASSIAPLSRTPIATPYIGQKRSVVRSGFSGQTLAPSAPRTPPYGQARARARGPTRATQTSKRASDEAASDIEQGRGGEGPGTNFTSLRNALLGAAAAASLSFPFSPVEPLHHAIAAEVAPTCSNAATYYAKTKDLDGPALKAELHDILKGHKVYTYTQAWDALKILDAADEKDPVNSKDIVEIYTRRHVDKSLAASADGWNREHLWPRSYGLVQGEPEFSDLHNLRPADVNVNSARGNKWYGECSHVTSADIGASCLIPANREAAPDTATSKLTWTPPKEVRGDIARALLYMDVRYNGKGDSSYDLALSDSPSIEKAQMGLLTALLQWHSMDPPSAPERLRNDRVCQMYQHNRNPFVDHPEFVPLIWGPAPNGTVPFLQAASASAPVAQAPAGAPTTSAASPASVPSSPSTAAPANAPTVSFPGPLPAWINEFHYDNIGTDEGEFVEVVIRPGVKPEEIKVIFYNGNDGKGYAEYKLSQFKAGPKEGAFGVFYLPLPPNGIQNGPADGFAVVQTVSGKDIAVQFITYEGALVATDGPAKGIKSVDIGASQNDKTPKGTSLGLVGAGKDSKDFKWSFLAKASPGSLNAGQTVSP